MSFELVDVAFLVMWRGLSAVVTLDLQLSLPFLYISKVRKYVLRYDI